MGGVSHANVKTVLGTPVLFTIYNVPGNHRQVIFK